MSTPSSGHGPDGWSPAPPRYGDYQGQPVGHQVFYGPPGPVAPVGTLPGDKSGGVAGLLSFLFPGLGQMYTGDVGRGVVWLVCALVGYPIAFLIIIFTLGFAAIILGPAILVFDIFAIIDAVNCAQRRNIRSRMTPSPAAYGGAVPPALPAALPPGAHPYPGGEEPPSVDQVPYAPPTAPPPSPTEPAGALLPPQYPHAPPTLPLPPTSKPPDSEDDLIVSLRSKSRPPAFCTECGHALSPTDTSCPGCGVTP